MNTTNKKLKLKNKVFTPSVNIIRDSNVNLNYIPTPNSKEVFTQIVNDYKVGIRCFSIVGAYGTGKSSFLWALEKNLLNKGSFFSSSNFSSSIKDFHFVKIVGEYTSFKSEISHCIGLSQNKELSSDDLFTRISLWYQAFEKKNICVVFLIDEFGKFLEYAAKNNPEKELYFIQRLAEFINDQRKKIFLVTTLHQDFNGYSRELNKSQQSEWDKVRGRLKEITFNEPVEQMLFLAAERLSKFIYINKDRAFSKFFKSIEKSKSFPLKDYFNETFAEKLLPFDILSASILTLSLQKYGQNERSLFSFIEANDQYGLSKFNSDQNPYYNVACVYDYLIHNYYSFLTTKFNPHHSQWVAIRHAIEKTEGLIHSHTSDAVKLIKTIGLINLFASASARINEEFLIAYGTQGLGIKDTDQLIKALVGHKIIRFVNYSNKFILTEGIDFDIDIAINEAGRLVERVTNVVHPLNSYFEFPYISAKAVYFRRGTPRIFSYHLSEAPERIHPEGEVDGIINLIFSENDLEHEILEVSRECSEAVIFGWYRNTAEISNLIFEIEKVKAVKNEHYNDRAAVRVLNGILEHQVKLLNHYVLDNLFSERSSVEWFYKGRRITIRGPREFNRQLSTICDDVYPSTPIFRNEMVNKTKLSGAISTARKNFLNALTKNSSEKDLGFDSKKFPPEKTIYLALLRETGIHHETSIGYKIGNPTNALLLFNDLWETCSSFLNTTKSSRRNLQEMVDLLISPPFKLKKGFIDFWLPIFLYAKRNDFALFNEDFYIPTIRQETLELICKDPKEYEIKSFDIEGIKLDIFNSYRELLNLNFHNNPGADTFIETIRPFLVFYSDLTPYTKNTLKLDSETLALRNSIAIAKDPEQAFFELFPKALNFNLRQLQESKDALAAYIEKLESCIKKLRSNYNDLVDRVESFILNEILNTQMSFPKYKETLAERYKNIKRHLLLPYQKAFYDRINTEVSESKDWLNSITFVCIEKYLEAISDEDEQILYDRLKNIIHELDNLCEISNSGFDENTEMAFKLEVTSFVEGLKKNLVRLPKSKNRELIQLQSILKAKFTNDRQLNIATLAKLLEDLLTYEK